MTFHWQRFIQSRKSNVLIPQRSHREEFGVGILHVLGYPNAALGLGKDHGFYFILLYFNLGHNNIVLPKVITDFSEHGDIGKIGLTGQQARVADSRTGCKPADSFAGIATTLFKLKNKRQHTYNVSNKPSAHRQSMKRNNYGKCVRSKLNNEVRL